MDEIIFTLTVPGRVHACARVCKHLHTKQIKALCEMQ